jgi:hypothetical protein
VTQDLLSIEADILIHTGDFCDVGSDEEYESFDQWLGNIRGRFSLGVFVVLGNHDYKFLNPLSQGDELIEIMASDEKRRIYMQNKLPNAVLLDNELHIISVGNHNDRNLTLSLFASPWNPFQSSPTHPDRVNMGTPKSDHDRVFQKWSESLPLHRKLNWTDGEAWRYDEIPQSVDILLTHIPPHGVFDKQPWFVNWGSSSPLLSALKQTTPRMHLFGHVHAQRGYWERVDDNGETEIVGGVQYASTTHEQERDGLLLGDGNNTSVQFLANSALMSDRTVKLFGKKQIAGKPRVIYGYFKEQNEGGRWYFRGAGGGQRA